mmetsp:Transcript_44/g.51  ORF Transcript_44/g.51 Transcript_44/m.51 type:complete len:517 (-) Transcript_44:96-1646(-)
MRIVSRIFKRRSNVHRGEEDYHNNSFASSKSRKDKQRNYDVTSKNQQRPCKGDLFLLRQDSSGRGLLGESVRDEAVDIQSFFGNIDARKRNEMTQRMFLREMEGNAMFDNSQFEDASYFLQEAAELRKQVYNSKVNQYSYELAKVCYRCAFSMTQNEKYTKAHVYCRKSISIFERRLFDGKTGGRDELDELAEYDQVIDLEEGVRNMILVEGLNGKGDRAFTDFCENREALRDSREKARMKLLEARELEKDLALIAYSTRGSNNDENMRRKKKKVTFQSTGSSMPSLSGSCSQEEKEDMYSTSEGEIFGSSYNADQILIPGDSHSTAYFQGEKAYTNESNCDTPKVQATHYFDSTASIVDDEQTCTSFTPKDSVPTHANINSSDLFPQNGNQVLFDAEALNRNQLHTIGEESDGADITSKIKLARVDLKFGFVRKAIDRLYAALENLDGEDLEDTTLYKIQILELLGDIECDHNENYSSGRSYYNEALSIVEDEFDSDHEDYHKIVTKLMSIAGLF